MHEIAVNVGKSMQIYEPFVKEAVIVSRLCPMLMSTNGTTPHATKAVLKQTTQEMS